MSEVNQARALLTEAMNWSVVKWLKEKKRVRQSADRANEVLDITEQQVISFWSGELKRTYEGLGSSSTGDGRAGTKLQLKPVDPKLVSIAQRVKQAFDEAHRLRMDAEATFDQAEKRLSTSLARDGCRKAISGWDQHERAIHLAETAEGGAK